MSRTAIVVRAQLTATEARSSSTDTERTIAIATGGAPSNMCVSHSPCSDRLSDRNRTTTERWGVYLIGFAAVTSILIPAGVDLNATHLFNPEWPGHARLHYAMSFIMSIGLGGAALRLIWQPERRRSGLLALAVFLAVWGWVAPILGGFIPGATYGNVAEDMPCRTCFPSWLSGPGTSCWASTTCRSSWRS